jgi:hypothetical protein
MIEKEYFKIFYFDTFSGTIEERDSWKETAVFFFTRSGRFQKITDYRRYYRERSQAVLEGRAWLIRKIESLQDELIRRSCQLESL